MMENIAVFKALAAILCVKVNELRNLADEASHLLWCETVRQRRAQGDFSDGDISLEFVPTWNELHLEEVQFKVNFVNEKWAWYCCIEEGESSGMVGQVFAAGHGAAQDEALIAAIADADAELVRAKLRLGREAA